LIYILVALQSCKTLRPMIFRFPGKTENSNHHQQHTLPHERIIPALTLNEHVHIIYDYGTLSEYIRSHSFGCCLTPELLVLCVD
jgi:hypothetical protein